MQSIYSRHKRSWLLGLFVECPYGEEVETCPAREIRKLSLDDRMEIAERVGLDVVDRFLERHRHCMSARERLPEA
jgi:hypothetical protein